MSVDISKDKSWLQRLRQGLARSSSQISEGIGSILFARKLDQNALDELEEILISADMGVQTAGELVSSLAKDKFGKEVSPEEIKQNLAENIANILRPVASSIHIDKSSKPHVVLVSGVNGTGKTTTIGKLAHQFHESGLKVMLAAGDTFRAAAIDQLQDWARELNFDVVAHQHGSDPSAVVFDALDSAIAREHDVILIDTAGRLQSSNNLMAELAKLRSNCMFWTTFGLYRV